MRFVIPGTPPSVNHMYVRFLDRKGRVHRRPSREAERWKEAIAWAARAAKLRHGWRCVPSGRKVVVKIWVFWPDNRRRDSDNIWKILLDGLKGQLFEDDRWVLPRVMDWQVDRQYPRVEVEVEIAEATECRQAQ
jgi:crossover junction endodeoxyribonuclease RusA